MTVDTSRPDTQSRGLRCILSLLAALLFSSGSALAAEPEAYGFFTRLAVTESVDASCSYPCATPVVEKVDLYLKGGFTIQGDKVIGSGEIEVIPHSECTVVADKGGGSGSSCRIAGPKSGGFTVSGHKSDVVRIAGDAFAPEVTITLKPSAWPDLLVNFFLAAGGQGARAVPVNHYQGSYQALLEQSGLVGRPFTLVAMKAENFVGDEVMGKMSREFTAGLELPAPGFVRAFRAAGTFAFTESPHRQ